MIITLQRQFSACLPITRWLCGPALALLVMSQPRATAQDVTPPELVSVSPPDQATGVAVGTPVQFTFSEPMKPQQGVDWLTATGAISGVSYSWSANRRTLTATPSPSWPPDNGVVFWSLNDAFFEDDAGNPLGSSNELSGFFLTASGSGTGGSPVSQYFLVNYRNYMQSGAAPPVTELDDPYSLTAISMPASNRPVTGISMQPPAGGPRSLSLLTPSPPLWYYRFATNDLAAFNGSFGDGNYNFTVTGGGSNELVTVTMPSVTHPSPPYIQNFAALQAVDPMQPFTVQFNACGTTTNYVLITVGPASSPGINEPGALNGTSTSWTIPANTLSNSTPYELISCCVVFTVATNATSVRYAEKAASTHIPLVTTAGGALRITSQARLPGGAFRVEAATQVGMSYTLERSTNLPTFFSLQTTNASSTNSVFLDSSAPAARAFYRVRKN